METTLTGRKYKKIYVNYSSNNKHLIELIELNNELNYDFPRSDLYFGYGSQKTEFLWRKKGSNFGQKYKIQIYVKK